MRHYSADNVFATLKGYLAAGKLRRYRARGALIMYVTSAIMDALEQSKTFTRQINLQTLTNNGMGIETRVTDIDGVPVMEVIDDERFYDKFDFTNGFAPVAHTASVVGSHKINVLIASQLSTFIVPKISEHLLLQSRHAHRGRWLSVPESSVLGYVRLPERQGR